jgi:hypothetical protein
LDVADGGVGPEAAFLDEEIEFDGRADVDTLLSGVEEEAVNAEI